MSSSTSTPSSGTTPTPSSTAATSVTDDRTYTPRYIDVGINLTDPIFTGIYHGRKHHDSDLPSIISRAKAVGCQKLLVTGSDLSESRAAAALASEHPGFLFATVGVHPCSAWQLDTTPDAAAEYMASLKTLALEGKAAGTVAAFGEIGLDYDRLSHASAEVQRKWFAAQLDVAEELDLPLFLHSRAAADDFEAALLPRLAVNGGKISGGVVHSFTGTVSEMRRLVAAGLYIGINGCSLKTDDNLDVVREVPLDRLMLESDGPWCEIRPSHASARVLKEAEVRALPGTPAVKKERFREGSMVKGRNEPAAIALVATVVARVKGVTEEVVCEAAWRNTVSVFGLGETVEG
ncbi:hypothetical protein EDC01DRAFT_662985 [Geopyxis carbonaria]|nr:hypothetical protein EDC01DRAFT_662985 [Geopyxis carbonaria]